jgi:predicted enzyme related to lactoylglutathione lyase
MGDYVLVEITETDKSRRPKTAGSINGGFYPKKEGRLACPVSIRRRRSGRHQSIGGKVLGEPMEIPGYGLYVSFFDTDGNRVSMMQPLEMRKGKAK